MIDDKKFILQSNSIKYDENLEKILNQFFDEIETTEKKLKKPILLLYDGKTKVFYVECHLDKDKFLKYKDENATIDPENQEDYRLNRALQPNNPDFHTMKYDAGLGRQFSDIVIEYCKLYRPEKPLKILGGQHRSKAIEEKSPTNTVHGLRIYFNLTKDQRAEIAKISNTNINIADDLLDRMEEQRLEPPNKLRNFAQNIKFLGEKEDFGDKKTNPENTPTVRLVRTFIVNFYKGKKYNSKADDDALESYLCESGGQDPEYEKIFHLIPEFTKDINLVQAGKNFVKLHQKQDSRASSDKELKRKKEFRSKALALAVVSAWAMVAGLLQKDKARLEKFYSLPNKCGRKDPLNAAAMSEYKLKGVDPATYRGIGARTEAKDRGRLVMIFLEYSKKESKDTIDNTLLEKAVRYYHANKMRKEGDKY